MIRLSILGKLSVALLCCTPVFGQDDCLLGLTGGDQARISEVFQLNGPQKALMDSLAVENAPKLDSVRGRIDELLAQHPQSTREEIEVMAKKYKAMQQEILEISRTADETLLKTFNTRQYERYLLLCKTAVKYPIKVAPVPVSPKK